MGPVRSLISLAAVAALVPFGTGCTTTGFGKSKKEPAWEVPAGVPSAGLSPQVKPGESGVFRPAGSRNRLLRSATRIAPAFSWMTGKSDKSGPKGPAVSVISAWQNRIDYLPDPTRDGEAGPGLAGQIFLLSPRGQPAIADGTLTVDLFDETPRAPGISPNKPERWQFKKDALKNLRMEDERFGQCYAVFLPWPTYRPDVTHVRVKVRFDPDQGGFPLYGEEMRISLDTTVKTVTHTGNDFRRLPIGHAEPAVRCEPTKCVWRQHRHLRPARRRSPVWACIVMGGGQPAGPATNNPSTAPTGTLPPAPPGYGALPPAAPGTGRAAGRVTAHDAHCSGSNGWPVSDSL